MTEQEPYGSAAAVEAAIRSAAQKSYASDPSVSISERIRQEHFRRFLSRIFSELLMCRVIRPPTGLTFPA